MPTSSSVYVPSLTISSFFPLTTIFTPPSDCFSNVGWSSPYGWPGSISAGLGPYPSCSPCWLGLPSSSSCFPSGWNVNVAASPGICPSGYTIACSSVNTAASETIATCCPSGFVCQPLPTGFGNSPWLATELCTSTFGTNIPSVAWLSDEVFLVKVTSFDGVGYLELTSETSTFTDESPATDFTGFSIYAYSVEIRFGGTTSLSSQTIRTTSLSRTTSYLGPTSNATRGFSSKGRTSLSPGASAGIAISVVFVFLTLALLSFVCLRRHNRRASKIAKRADNLQGLFLKPELEAGTPQVKAEKPLTTNEISELDTSPAPVSHRQHQTLGSVENSFLPKHEVPTVLEMEAPHVPEDSPIQASSGTLRTPVFRKSVPTEPQNTLPQVQQSSSRPSKTFSNESEGTTIQQEIPPSDSKTNPTSVSIEDEIQRIREERERLSRLMELDRMEERLRQQLQARDSGVQ